MKIFCGDSDEYSCQKLNDDTYKVTLDSGDVFLVSKNLYEKYDAEIDCSDLDSIENGKHLRFDVNGAGGFSLILSGEINIRGANKNDIVTIACNNGEINGCDLKVLNSEGIRAEKVNLEYVADSSVHFSEPKSDVVHLYACESLKVKCSGKSIVLYEVVDCRGGANLAEFACKEELRLDNMEIRGTDKAKGKIIADHINLLYVDVDFRDQCTLKVDGDLVLNSDGEADNGTLNLQGGDKVLNVKCIVGDHIGNVDIFDEVKVDCDINMVGDEDNKIFLKNCDISCSGEIYTKQLECDNSSVNFGEFDVNVEGILRICDSNISFEKIDNTAGLSFDECKASNLKINNVEYLGVTGGNFENCLFSDIDEVGFSLDEGSVIKNTGFKEIGRTAFENAILSNCEIIGGDTSLKNCEITDSTLEDNVDIDGGESISLITSSRIDNSSLKGVTLCDASEIVGSKVSSVTVILNQAINGKIITSEKELREDYGAKNSEVKLTNKENVMDDIEL